MQIKSLISDFTSHWKSPAEGNFISNKEVASYSAGGIGPYTINALFGQYVVLASTCFLIGSAYGIKPMDLAFLSVLMGVLNLVKTPFVSMLLDNTKSSLGKFRPYLIYTGVPTVCLLTFMAFIPLDFSYRGKLLLIGAAYALLMLFQSLFQTAYDSLGQVMTPNEKERTSLLSVSAFVGNLGPSILGALIPILANFTGGMDNIRTYRVLFPVFSIFGILLSLWVFAGTRERIFVPKNYVQRVSFFEGIRQLAGNGHFWLLSISQVLGGLRYCVDSIPNWYCFYVLDSNTMMGLSAIVMGTASVPGMLLAPMLAKTFGKKNVLIFGNLIRVAASVGMFFCLEHVVPLAVLMYVSKLAVGAEFVLTQSMIADIFDLQQWKTGKRLEGFIGQFNKFLIAGFGMLTGLIMPYFYQQYGLGTDYNVLREAEVHMPIFRALIVATTLSCLLSVIPLLFYRLTGRQQKQMMEELAARAAADNGGESA